MVWISQAIVSGKSVSRGEIYHSGASNCAQIYARAFPSVARPRAAACWPGFNSDVCTATADSAWSACVRPCSPVFLLVRVNELAPRPPRQLILSIKVELLGDCGFQFQRICKLDLLRAHENRRPIDFKSAFGVHVCTNIASTEVAESCFVDAAKKLIFDRILRVWF